MVELVAMGGEVRSVDSDSESSASVICQVLIALFFVCAFISLRSTHSKHHWISPSCSRHLKRPFQAYSSVHPS